MGHDRRLPDVELLDHCANTRRLSELVGGDPTILRWPFLCDPDRRVLERLGLRETTDTQHDPTFRAHVRARPDLTVDRQYDGYWFLGRPTLAELVRDLREVSAAMRAPTP